MLVNNNQIHTLQCWIECLYHTATNLKWSFKKNLQNFSNFFMLVHCHSKYTKKIILELQIYM